MEREGKGVGGERGEGGGWRERVRWGCGVVKLMKEKKGGGNHAVFYFTGKRFFFYL
jgi:hypothetical protein